VIFRLSGQVAIEKNTSLKGVGEATGWYGRRRKKVSQTKANNQEYYKTDTVGGAIG